MALPQPDFGRLYQVLNNTREQIKSNALYQLLKALIQDTQQARDNLVARVGSLEVIISGSGVTPGLANQTFLTTTDQVATLPNSRELTEGMGIEFNDATAGERQVNLEIHPFFFMRY